MATANSQPHPIPELLTLSKALEAPERLASGSQEIQDAALGAAKFIFDLSLKSEETSLKHVNDLILSITPSQGPQTRSQARATNKEAPALPKHQFQPTPLTSLFTDNLDEDQIWAQLDIRTKHMCDVLGVVLEGDLPDEDDVEGSESDSDSSAEDMEDNEALLKAIQKLREEGVEFDEFEEEDDSNGDSETGSESADEDEVEDDSGDESAEGVMDLNNEDSEQEDVSKKELTPTQMLPRKRKRGITSELDDGFFELSSFKAEIEKAEAKSSSRGRLAAGDDSDDSDEDLDDVDLFAPVEEGADDESKELFYSDFFEAPRAVPGKRSNSTNSLSSSGTSRVRFNEEVRVKNIKSRGTGKSSSRKPTKHFTGEDDDSSEDGADEETAFNEGWEDEGGSGEEEDEEEEAGSDSEEETGRDTIERLKDDLFADDDDVSTKDMTAHEKRMAELKAQIEELEAENVGEKPWTLKGEASSRTRPENALLEEDLEFERNMKPTPVITEEAVHSLEEVIKARILENRFDDVVRIRPMDDKPFLPSRLLELKDTKSAQSLAQIYENDYMAAQSGEAVIDDRDGKLKKEHEEIEQQWDKICEKLDALSNAHFVPKQPKTLISTVSNVSTTTMESALPTSKSAVSMLAPEEVFAAESSQPRARSEMTPAEKRSLRAKERKIKKKQRDMLGKTVDKVAKMRGISGVKKQKQAALESIVKHGKGVTVVGKAAKDLKSKGKLRNKKRL